jgi:hypothetical protein
MIDLSGVPMLDIAIGLAFMYFLLSIVCSSISEIISAVLRLRARNLEAGLRVLLGSREAANAFYEDWRIDILHTPKWTNRHKTRKSRKPSYIAPETVARAVLDTFAPDAIEKAKKLDPDTPPSKDQLTAIEGTIDKISDPKTKRWLAGVVADARGDIEKIRASVEGRFNELMDRATGWYKRKMQVILFVIALAVAGGLNADTINVADRLARDEALRAYVVTQAQNAGEDAQNTSPTAQDVEDQINAARASGLPLGWGGENVPNYPVVFVVLAKAAGLAITAFALMLGAPFWFDVLGKFSRLRSSGNRVGTPKDDSMAPTDRDDRLTRKSPAAASGV